MFKVLRIFVLLFGVALVLLALAATHFRFAREVFLQSRDLASELVDPDVVSDAPRIDVSDERVHFEGVPNCGRISDHLYRSAQPTAEGFRTLKQAGFDLIINFRDEPGEIDTEKHQVSDLGMQYVSVPWSATRDPSDAELRQFFTILRQNQSKRILVHCRAGHDRTGVMIAAYRISVDHWPANRALGEMEAFGFKDGLRHFWLHHLQEYVENLPGRYSAALDDKKNN